MVGDYTSMIRTLVLLLFSAPAFAAGTQYNISMKLKSNGKEISSPSVVVKEGETAKITQRDNDGTTFWEVVANEKREGILLNFTVGKIDKDGHQSVLSKPKILALENEPAEMTVGQSGNQILTLSVVAKRKVF
jgi:type II secretory pathway component GspD/PulD (secretin)